MTSTAHPTPDLHALFASHPELPKLVSATPLSGGITNNVFRCTATDADGKTVVLVVKMFWPFLASTGPGGWKLELKRSEIEHHVMARVPKTLHSRVAAPSPIAFLRIPAGTMGSSEDATVLVESDAGAETVTLKHLLLSAASSLTEATYLHIGRALGEWLSRFHAHFSALTETGREAQRELRELEGGNGNWELWFAVTYGRLRDSYSGSWPEGVVETVTGDAKKRGYTSQDGGGQEQQLTATVVMGDFWTGNVLVDTSSTSTCSSSISPTTAQEQSPNLTILDYEISRPGYIWEDIGQMTAELYLCVFFSSNPEARKDAEDTLAAFHASYRDETKRVYGEEFLAGQEWGHMVKLALRHAAVHWVVWPQSTGWEPKEKVEELKTFAVGLLTALVQDGEGWRGKVKEEGLGELLQ